MSAMDMHHRDETLYRQAHLVEVVPHIEALDQWVVKKPKVERTCWLPSAGLKPFKVVSLKGEEGFWWIQNVDSTEKPRYLLHTDWNVGGLEEGRPTKKDKRKAR
jgi:hypothetical protein